MRNCDKTLPRSRQYLVFKRDKVVGAFCAGCYAKWLEQSAHTPQHLDHLQPVIKHYRNMLLMSPNESCET